MSLLQQALSVMGNKETMTSGELLWRLDPDYLAHYGSRQRGGYWLAQALGVRPHHFFDPTRQRWRSIYYRADLEAAAGSSAPVAPAPAPPVPAPAPYDYAKAGRPAPLPPGAIDFPPGYEHRTGTPEYRAL